METLADTRRFPTIEVRHRYKVLLLSIVMLLPVLLFIRGDELAIFMMKLVLSIILLSGIYAGRRMPRDLIVGGALGIPVLVGRWLPQYSSDIRVFLAIDFLTAVFLLYITVIILNQVMSASRVTLDTIAGAVCAYFLIGLAGAFVDRAIFVINPHSFLFAPASFGRIFEDQKLSEPQLMNFAYCSFATLTTTGFGNITPASGAARALSVLEAIAGQLFIAVLIARLVSLEIVHSGRLDSNTAEGPVLGPDTTTNRTGAETDAGRSYDQRRRIILLRETRTDYRRFENRRLSMALRRCEQRHPPTVPVFTGVSGVASRPCRSAR